MYKKENIYHFMQKHPTLLLYMISLFILVFVVKSVWMQLVEDAFIEGLL
jgi:hypothetical protein